MQSLENMEHPHFQSSKTENCYKNPSNQMIVVVLQNKIYHYLKNGFHSNDDATNQSSTHETTRHKAGLLLLKRLLPHGIRSNHPPEPLQSLIRYIQLGTASDLHHFMKQTIDMRDVPLGLQKQFQVMLEMERLRLQFHDTVFNPLNDETVKASIGIDPCLAYNSLRRIRSLWTAWKNGRITVTMLFSKINAAAALQLISPLEAKELTRFVLQEGEHSVLKAPEVASPVLSHKEVPIFQETPVCYLSEVTNLYSHKCRSGGEILTLRSSNGSFTSVHAERGCDCGESDDYEEIHFSASRSMPSSPFYVWETCSDYENLFLTPSYSINQSPSIQTRALIIGDTILLRECVIDVHEVIMCDVLISSVDMARDIQIEASAMEEQETFVILIEGTMSAGAGPTTDISQLYSRVLNKEHFDTCNADGVTEVGSPIRRSGSSQDSNDDPRYFNIPPFELKRKYFLLFVQCNDGRANIWNVSNFNEILHPDQIPTNVKAINTASRDSFHDSSLSCSAIIYGSNGLLCVVQPLSRLTKLPTHLQKDDHSSSIILTGIRGYSIYNSLCFDCFPSEMESSPPHCCNASHMADVTITTVDYSSSCGRLVSADDTGFVCLWEIYQNEFCIECQLIAGPFQVVAGPSHIRLLHRIHNVTLSVSGEHFAVALRDQLLLVGVKPMLTNGKRQEKHILFVRSCLDIVCNISAIYSVRFDINFIQVWRITERKSLLPQLMERVSSNHDFQTVVYDHNYDHHAVSEGDRMVAMDYDSDYDVNHRKDDDSVNQAVSSCVLLDRGPTLQIASWKSLNVDSVETRTGYDDFETWMKEQLQRYNHASGDIGIKLSFGNDALPTDTMRNPYSEADFRVPDEVEVEETMHQTYSYRKQRFWKIGGEHIPEFFIPELSSDGVCLYNPELHQRDDSELQQEMNISYSEHDDEGTMADYRTMRATNATIGIGTDDITDDGHGFVFGNIRRSLSAPRLPINAIDLEDRFLLPESTGDRMIDDNRGDVTSGRVAYTRTLFHMGDSLESFTNASIVESGQQNEDAIGVTVNHRGRNYQHYLSYGMVRIDETMNSLDVAPQLQTSSAGEDEESMSSTTFFHGRTPSLRLDPVHGTLVTNSLYSSKYYRVGSNISTVRLRYMTDLFGSDCSPSFQKVRSLLGLVSVSLQSPAVVIISAALDLTTYEIMSMLQSHPLLMLLEVREVEQQNIVAFRKEFEGYAQWLCSFSYDRIGKEFWIDPSLGHNLFCALYLRYCSNKSVAIEHPWQDYLRCYGATHLRHSSRALRLLTTNIRKIDETANIRGSLPRQVGYISGLYEIYARRVGLKGRIPKELGYLKHLRVLSMGNNHLSGELPESLGSLQNLQRVVLHQNNLRGAIPASLDQLGCIVNLAGNPLLEYGPDIPKVERLALIELFTATKGTSWTSRKHWCSDQPVSRWYKVGVLSSHVHSLVMSSNGMDGMIPASIKRLKHLRMVELATMPGLRGSLPKELCSITTLRRLCICRCAISGRLPPEIGQLTGLEELQLFGNNISGKLPETMSNLTNLRLLSLGEYTGGNNFSPGPIPLCIAKMTKLEALFLANCNLRGEFPEWISDLIELRQLDLQRNELRGPMPRSIRRLHNLLYLNIKDNEGMSGPLPVAELLALTKLNRLSLVHCAFDNAQVVVDAMRDQLPRCKVWI